VSVRNKPVRPLVTLSITIDHNGDVFDDTQTYGNSYADVYHGIVAVKAEVERQINERRNCPFNPKYGRDEPWMRQS